MVRLGRRTGRTVKYALSTRQYRHAGAVRQIVGQAETPAGAGQAGAARPALPGGLFLFDRHRVGQAVDDDGQEHDA